MNLDVTVIGLGAVGSATACHLAALGAKTLGLDQYKPPHNRGSSHGETRITRQASGEGSHLTALALRSIAIWQELEERFSMSGLFTRTGLLAISSPFSDAHVHVDDFFESTVSAARENEIEH
ncbi:MAG: FAD-dependent oxidoreductase, partial [Cyanobacteriota/Melainabacteria group bacterium]